MFILAGILAVGLVCNWLIRPVDPKHYMTAEQLAATAPKQAAGVGAPAGVAQAAAAPEGDAAGWLIALAWLAVWIPLGWGIWVTLQKAVLLFK
jgi:hypothetical protein